MRLARFAWLVLGWNVAVILWGAFVRATGSGAGCGAHWPLCNGEVVPRAPALETMVEFTHRATSGLALMLVAALCLWVFREKPKGHPARRAAGASVFFILTEAAVGAGLVLFGLVGQNDSVARALFMAGHLANTFVLLACLTLTAHWCASEARLRPAAVSRLGWVFAAGAIALVGVGKSGAVAALGDTLYPAQSVLGGLAQDLSPTAHFLVQLRIAHPILALAGALLVAFAASRVLQATEDGGARSAAWAVSALALLQLGGGLLNVALLAPVWMQIVHLLLADLLWIAFVLLAVRALSLPLTGAGEGRGTGPGRLEVPSRAPGALRACSGGQPERHLHRHDHGRGHAVDQRRRVDPLADRLGRGLVEEGQPAHHLHVHHATPRVDRRTRGRRPPRGGSPRRPRGRREGRASPCGAP